MFVQSNMAEGLEATIPAPVRGFFRGGCAAGFAQGYPQISLPQTAAEEWGHQCPRW